MRKLASIRRITNITPIPDADAIECAEVDGWKVVVKKGEYKVGELAIYCEIDSWIPHDLAPFLSKGKEPREYNGVKGERLRTARLRGQLSQGLLLPTVGNTPLTGEGDDLTEFLGIQKWEAPIPAQLAGQVRGNFPSAIPKTDQERIQNLSRELNAWTASPYTWEVTEKLDGSSCTFYLDADGELHVCSRNLDLAFDPNNSFWKAALQYDIKDRMLDESLYHFAIQGELIGEGIQGNPYNFKGQDFYVFDMYDAVFNKYRTPANRREVAEALGLKHVPVLLTDKDLVEGHTIDEILTWAEGKSQLNPSTEREGLVFKSNLGTVSFKAISNKFLLKQK